MRGQRAVVTGAGQVELAPFEPPQPQAGQVVLRASTTLISPGTERAFFLGLENTSRVYPLYPGYSMVGEVAACGEGVANVEVGDRVACPAGHASHAVADANICLRVPADLGDDEAVFFNLMAIAMQGVRKARIELGESVAVLGAGLIGILAMRLAQLSGGLPVVGIDLDTQRLALAQRIGADETLSGGERVGEALRHLLGGAGADVVIEATGVPALVASAFGLAADGGRVVLLGSTRGESERVNFYRDVHKKGLHIMGAHESARPLHESSPGYWTKLSEQSVCLELLRRKRVKVEPLITHRYTWRDLRRAYAHLADWDKEAMGILIKWS